MPVEELLEELLLEELLIALIPTELTLALEMDLTELLLGRSSGLFAVAVELGVTAFGITDWLDGSFEPPLPPQPESTTVIKIGQAQVASLVTYLYISIPTD